MGLHFVLNPVSEKLVRQAYKERYKIIINLLFIKE